MRVDAAVDCVPEPGAGHLRGVGADDLGEREVELVHGRVDRVVLDRRDHVEPGLFNTKGEPAGPGEEVDGDRATAGDHGQVSGAPSRLRTCGSHAAILRRADDDASSGARARADSAVYSDARDGHPDAGTAEPDYGRRQRHAHWPEVVLRSALFAAGVRGWRCHCAAGRGAGHCLAGPTVAVFVDGAFWHGHPSRHRPGRSGAYWDEKIEANVARDRAVDVELRELGWKVVRIWDFEVRKHLDEAVVRVQDALFRPGPGPKQKGRPGGAPSRGSLARTVLRRAAAGG